MTLQEFVDKYKAIVTGIYPIKLEFDYKGKSITVRHTYFFRQNSSVVINGNTNIEYTFNSLSDLDFCLDSIVDINR
jgi:hypothetical protein